VLCLDQACNVICNGLQNLLQCWFGQGCGQGTYNFCGSTLIARIKAGRHFTFHHYNIKCP